MLNGEIFEICNRDEELIYKRVPRKSTKKKTINKGNEQKILIAHRKVNTNGSLKHVNRCSLTAGVGTSGSQAKCG